MFAMSYSYPPGAATTSPSNESRIARMQGIMSRSSIAPPSPLSTTALFASFMLTATTPRFASGEHGGESLVSLFDLSHDFYVSFPQIHWNI